MENISLKRRIQELEKILAERKKPFAGRKRKDPKKFTVGKKIKVSVSNHRNLDQRND